MISRRAVLSGASVALAGAAAMAARAGEPAGRAGIAPPRDVGRKFYPDGRVMPFAGNTIICHLPQQGERSEAFHALLDIYRALPAYRFARKITALPPSSYHMTVFGGANDKERRYPLWPSDLPLDLPLIDCNRILGERLKAARFGIGDAPFRMRLNPAEPGPDEMPLTIRLIPADAQEALRLRTLRERISQVLRIRAPDQDRYEYHVTLAYLIDWLDAGERREFRSALDGWRKDFARRVPLLEIGPPEYCVLTDMFAFDRQFFLA